MLLIYRNCPYEQKLKVCPFIKEKIHLLFTVKSCWSDGKEYPVGTTNIPKGDGCNTCTCQYDGSLSCTKVACGKY